MKIFYATVQESKQTFFLALCVLKCLPRFFIYSNNKTWRLDLSGERPEGGEKAFSALLERAIDLFELQCKPVSRPCEHRFLVT